MSKRGMEMQGGGERYGGMADDRGAPEEKPQQATAAQMARRKILSAKGKATPRGSRANSPAVVSQPQANPFQTFAPPPTANSFSFSVPGSTPAPTFGQAPTPQQNGGMFGGQQNGTPSFGAFGNNQNGNATSNVFSGINTSQPQTNGFNPTPSFSFGQSQPNTASTPSTSFSFGQSQSQSQEQPKTNGFNPSTTSLFSGGSFGGQQSQPRQNGTTPAFSFGQSQPPQEQPQKPSTPSFNFGQSQQTNGVDKQPASTGLFGSTPAPAPPATSKPGESIFSNGVASANAIKPGFSFGQSQPPQDDDEPAQPSKPTFSFGQPAQQNGAQTPKAAGNPFAGFKFGEQTKPNEEQTPKTAAPASSNNFGQQPQTNGEQTPKPNPFAGFKFGQSEQPAADKPAEPPRQKENEAPKSNDLFGGIGQEKKPETPFKSGQSQNLPEQTPKPTLFSGVSQQPNGTPGFKFGPSQQEDTSMLSPENTPHKQPSQHAPSQQSAVPETPADSNAGKSMFDRISRDPPATAPKAPSFSFGAPAQSNTDEAEEQPNPNAGKSLFDRMTPRDPEPPATAPKPSSTPRSMPASTPAPAPAPPTFSLTAPTPAPSSSRVTAAKSANSADRQKLKSLNEGLLSHLKTEDPTQDWSMIFHFYINQAAKLMGRDADKAPVAAQPPKPQEERKALPAPPDAAASSGSFGGRSDHAPPSTPKPPSAANMFFQATTTPKAPPPTNMFSQAAQPPVTAPVNRKRSADDDLTKDTSAAQQAPGSEKRARPNESAAPVEYPKLPENASKTAQLFASTLEKPSKPSGSPSFGPPEDVMAKVREQKAAREAQEKTKDAPPAFKPSTSFSLGGTAGGQKDAETPSAPKFGFAPATQSAPATDKPAEGSKAPKFGFTPTTSSATDAFKPPSFGAAPGGNSFLSSFGQKAEKESEKARKRRMDEDYDSDEEDRDAWEKKDREEQEAKKRKIEEAAKAGPIFKLPGATSGAGPKSAAPFAFKLPGADESADGGEKNGATDEPLNPNAGKSLFDRISPATPAPASSSTPSLFSTQTPKQGSTTSNIFSQAGSTPAFKFGAPTPSKGAETDKAVGEREQGKGDNTWKPSTPIKFGAATGNESTTPAAAPPANPFAGLFGSNATPATAKKDAGAEAGKLAPPNLGFTFGGPKGTGNSTADASRATTPGVTTDGEASTAGDAAAEGEPSDEQIDAQVEDMTALLPEERESEDVLFEAAIAKAMKLDQKQTDGGMVPGWVERGKGPLYILKNKSSGKTRVLMKIPPLGRPVMNFAPLKGCEYKCAAGKKVMSGTFIDHFDNNKERAGRPTQWTIQVKEAKDAQEIARILEEEKERS